MKRIIQPGSRDKNNVNNVKKHDKKRAFLATALSFVLSCSPIQEENLGPNLSCNPKELIVVKKMIEDCQNVIIAAEGETISLECGIDIKIEDLDFKDGLRKVKIIKQKDDVSFTPEYNNEKLIAISCDDKDTKIKLNFDKNGYELSSIILLDNNKEIALKSGEAIYCQGNENTYDKDIIVNLKFVRGLITKDSILIIQYFIEPVDQLNKNKLLTLETLVTNYPFAPFLLPFTNVYLADYKTCD